jgi:hypothetical protein
MLKGSNYNPDVLNCLANLSSDEVFTPPAMANRILDLLPAKIFSDKNATFLDPVCKSGVFLREIAKRLDAGLEKGHPRQAEAAEPHLRPPALRPGDHRDRRAALAAIGLLPQDRQRQVLRLRKLRRRAAQHLVQVAGASRYREIGLTGLCNDTFDGYRQRV